MPYWRWIDAISFDDYQIVVLQLGGCKEFIVLTLTCTRSGAWKICSYDQVTAYRKVEDVLHLVVKTDSGRYTCYRCASSGMLSVLHHCAEPISLQYVHYGGLLLSGKLLYEPTNAVYEVLTFGARYLIPHAHEKHILYVVDSEKWRSTSKVYGDRVIRIEVREDGSLESDMYHIRSDASYEYDELQNQHFLEDGYLTASQRKGKQDIERKFVKLY
jgi:hypothetical protein